MGGKRPLQNRVTPFGELIADPARGLVYGNRGCLHDGSGRIRRHHQVRRWIACRLEFKGWQRGRLLQPGRFTELFFLDEATALAAGHRPCGLCRRADYDRFVELAGGGGADALDERLQEQRWSAGGRSRRLHGVALEKLPDGAFVVAGGDAWLVLGGSLRRWTPAGYAERAPRADGAALLLTPPLMLPWLRELREPLVPRLHATAQEAPSPL